MVGSSQFFFFGITGYLLRRVFMHDVCLCKQVAYCKLGESHTKYEREKITLNWMWNRYAYSYNACNCLCFGWSIESGPLFALMLLLSDVELNTRNFNMAKWSDVQTQTQIRAWAHTESSFVNNNFPWNLRWYYIDIHSIIRLYTTPSLVFFGFTPMWIVYVH